MAQDIRTMFSLPIKFGVTELQPDDDPMYCKKEASNNESHRHFAYVNILIGTNMLSSL